jgi:hypothetical protein
VQVTRIDYAAIAMRLRTEADSGLLTTRFDIEAARYVLRCSHRMGTSTIVFTRDEAWTEPGGYSDPMHARGYHLSLSCVERAERELWVRAFFGPNVPLLWACWWWTRGGREFQVSHWRLFCDPQWSPIAVRNTADVARKGWRPAIDMGLAIVPS